VFHIPFDALAKGRASYASRSWMFREASTDIFSGLERTAVTLVSCYTVSSLLWLVLELSQVLVTSNTHFS